MQWMEVTFTSLVALGVLFDALFVVLVDARARRRPSMSIKVVVFVVVVVVVVVVGSTVILRI